MKREDKPQSETVVLQQAIDPGPPAPPDEDMMAGLETVTAGEVPTGPVKNLEAPVQAGADPMVAGLLGDIPIVHMGPVHNPEVSRGEALGPMLGVKQNHRQIMTQHMRNLHDDVIRLMDGQYNILKKALGRQTLGADLLCLYQVDELRMDQTMGFVEIYRHEYQARIMFTLPKGKVTSRIQQELMKIGFESTTTEENVILLSPVHAPA